MKIIAKNVKDPINFEDLSIGDVFKEVGGENIYLRLDTVHTDDNDYFNSVELYSMDYVTFSNSDKIVKLDAELVIS